jgi:general secretion pathway protein D
MPSSGAEDGQSAVGAIPVHYKQRDIADIVSMIARATGQRFIFDDTLRGRVTVTVPYRVNPQEALAILDAALFVKGFAALPVGEDTTKIVPLTESQSGSPITAVPLDPEGGRVITTMIRLRHADANEAVTALGPNVSEFGAALPYEPANSVILSGPEAQVARLIAILRMLDQAADENILVRTVRYRSATTIAEILEVTFNEGRRQGDRVGIWADERTNQVLVQTSPVRLEAIRKTIEKIDRLEEGEGLVRVVRVLNRPAEDISAILIGMKKGRKNTRAGERRAIVEELGESLESRAFNVAVDTATRSLLLSSDSETLGLLTRVIHELDRIPPRVAVDVMVFELVRPSGFKLGINYFLPVLEPSSATDPAVFISSGGASLSKSSNLLGTGVPTGPAVQDFLFGRYARSPLQLTLDPGGGADPITVNVPRDEVSFEAGESLAETNILMRPHILAMSGEEHRVFVGNEIPVPVGTTVPEGEFVGTAGALANQQTIERREVGIDLIIKATVGKAGVAELDLKIELSEIQSSIAGPVDQVGPTFTQRTIESTLMLGEGDIAVIGASNGSGESVSVVGIPFLKDIPFFGSFFSSQSRTRVDNDLVIVVKAQILRTPSEDAAYSIRQRIAMERAISRVADLESVDAQPYALLLETFDYAGGAERIASAFDEDGFESRVTSWQSTSGTLWDVYLTGFATIEEASGLAGALYDAGWSPEVTVLSPENIFAGD